MKPEKNLGFDGASISASQIPVGRFYQLSYEATCCSAAVTCEDQFVTYHPPVTFNLFRILFVILTMLTTGLSGDRDIDCIFYIRDGYHESITTIFLTKCKELKQK